MPSCPPSLWYADLNDIFVCSLLGRDCTPDLMQKLKSCVWIRPALPPRWCCLWWGIAIGGAGRSRSGREMLFWRLCCSKRPAILLGLSLSHLRIKATSTVMSLCCDPKPDKWSHIKALHHAVYTRVLLVLLFCQVCVIIEGSVRTQGPTDPSCTHEENRLLILKHIVHVAKRTSFFAIVVFNETVSDRIECALLLLQKVVDGAT